MDIKTFYMKGLESAKIEWKTRKNKLADFDW